MALRIVVLVWKRKSISNDHEWDQTELKTYPECKVGKSTSNFINDDNDGILKQKTSTKNINK